ncbi:MAG: hypothetical protein WCG05_00350 [Alphaproteobacteria bacterium]
MNKFLKATSFYAVACIASNLIAAEPKAENAFEGVSLNALIGYGQVDAKHRTVYGTSGGRYQGTFSGGALNVKAGLGYGKNLRDSYNWGAELYGFYNPLRTETFLANPIANAIIGRNFGGGVKTTIGYFLAQSTLGYVGVGAEGSVFNFKMKTQNFNQLTNSRFLWATGPVAGVKVALSSATSLVVEGNYMFYQAMRISGLNGISPLSSRISPRVLSLNLGLSINL